MGGGSAGMLAPIAGANASAGDGSAAVGAGASALAGSAGVAGVAGVAGAAGSAGVAGVQAGAAGASGTAAGNGSSGQAGVAGTSSGAGGAMSGMGGAMSGAGGEPSDHVPTPSPGCGSGERPDGGVVTVMDSHIYSFPESYDGTTPMPLIIAFHAAGNHMDQLRNITRGSALEQHFVMAFPESTDNGWSPDADSSKVDQRYEELRQSYCIDESRVFATGHSSGAQMIVQLLCAGEDRYVAVAPVASSAYCPSWDAAVPALIIHGANDRERANTNQDADGVKDLAPYLASNGCEQATVPYEQAGCSSGGTQVDPGCVEHQGCDELTVWCQHDDPQYGTTNHGWPCFANAAMDAFFTRFL
jgi:hypothetical protein